MLDRETCREHILSEDYRDFIGNHVRTPFFNSLMNVHRCEQEAGFSYKCFYLPKEISDPITLPKYSYASIPNCYSPLNMQTLNEAGILPVQNYPTLQLKGRNILIGFLDSGIDYTNPVFQNLDNTTRIRAIWDQTVQTGTMPEHFSYRKYLQPCLSDKNFCDKIFQPMSDFLCNPVTFFFLRNSRQDTHLVVI